MKIAVKCFQGQSNWLLIFCLFIFSACTSNNEEGPVIPPVTSPLTRDYIGFGVITSSFTHVTEDPQDNSRSLGYLRRGSLVKIVRRQIVRTPDGFTSWVLSDGNPQGWLREDVMEIFNNESQARTASELIPK
jgi:hypothetical protein